MTRPKSAIVTGATGHVGSALCRALALAGYDVTALVRPTSSLAALAGLDLRIVHGDVLDERTVEQAVHGRTAVFHNAALFALDASPDLVHRVAIEGTKNVLGAAARAGARVVWTGSVVAVGFGQGPGDLLDERAWAEHVTIPYYRAKVESERVAMSTAEALGVELVRILPTLVLGPGDCRVTPSSRLLVDMLSGRGATFEGGANVIDVRDLAQALVAAYERGRPGARYIAGGENLLVRDIGAIVASIVGRPVRHVALPRPLLSTIAGAMELVSALTGASPPMTRAIVRDVIGRFAWYDVTQARTELGLVTRPAEETIRDAARWFAKREVVPAIQSLDLGSEVG